MNILKSTTMRNNSHAEKASKLFDCSAHFYNIIQYIILNRSNEGIAKTAMFKPVFEKSLNPLYILF